jgi:hypothetical protein
MKKVIYGLFSGVVLLVACGPNAEEQAKEQQRIADSAASAAAAETQARIQDSLAQAAVFQAQEAQRLTDSLQAVAVADSIAKASQKKATSSPKKLIKQDEAPKTAKPAQGRG